MLSSIIRTIQFGLESLQRNTPLLLVAVLVFVFPLLFIWGTNQVFSVATANIETAEKQRIYSFHQTLSQMINDQVPANTIDSTIDSITESNPDLRKIRIVAETGNDMVVLHSLDEALIGTSVQDQQPYLTLSGQAVNDPIIRPFAIDGDRVWQVFRIIRTDNAQFYLFTEHNFSDQDSLLAERQQRSYIVLSGIFIFLIALAYWISRQENWQKRAHQLSVKLEDRDLFANTLAHELRSPLTAIRGYVTLLKESDTTEEDRLNYLNSVHSASDRLLNLVNDFLEISRIHAGKLSLEPRDTDLRPILSQLLMDMRPLADEKGLRLDYQAGPQPIIATVDADRFVQVMTNIVSNAIKYTERGVVKIEGREIRGGVELRVEDTGMGISAEDQKKLFQPFSRVGQADEKPITGSGLGMWITKQLVELQKGSITVESIKGVGTHVVIKLIDD